MFKEYVDFIHQMGLKENFRVNVDFCGPLLLVKKHSAGNLCLVTAIAEFPSKHFTKWKGIEC